MEIERKGDEGNTHRGKGKELKGCGEEKGKEWNRKEENDVKGKGWEEKK